MFQDSCPSSIHNVVLHEQMICFRFDHSLEYDSHIFTTTLHLRISSRSEMIRLAASKLTLSDSKLQALLRRNPNWCFKLRSYGRTGWSSVGTKTHRKIPTHRTLVFSRFDSTYTSCDLFFYLPSLCGLMKERESWAYLLVPRKLIQSQEQALNLDSALRLPLQMFLVMAGLRKPIVPDVRVCENSFLFRTRGRIVLVQ